MDFYIYGTNFFNKGAELMTHAVKQQVQEWDQNNTVSADLRNGTFEQRRQAGINHLAYVQKQKTREKIPIFLANRLPKSIRRKYGIKLEPEIDAILDASGFAYGDQCGSGRSERTANLYSQWKKRGKKIILLPQAFGPFDNEIVKKAFIKLAAEVDLIYARDEISYQYISQLPIPMERVKIAPDFTNLVKGVEPEYIKDLTGKPCVIPNRKMLDRTSPEVSNTYLPFLSASINHLLDQGLEPFILVHEEKDLELCKQLQAQAGRKVPVITEENPLYLKGILGKCHLVVGSRFHGLVSALSQGTPCLGTGWSHKYQMLFESYGCTDLVVDFNNNLEDNLKKIDLIIHEPTRSRIVESITQAATHQKELSQKMWEQVRNLL